MDDQEIQFEEKTNQLKAPDKNRESKQNEILHAPEMMTKESKEFLMLSRIFTIHFQPSHEC
jgi:hypothetical protein